MAGGKLSPRQKMINMMYLVLTALLALNVSKEVLNSFFEVNLSILKTSDALEDKNTETYQAFELVQNKKKVEEYKRLANLIKPESKDLIDFIQEMKYHLVLESDGNVFLGDGFKEEEKRKAAQENTNDPNPYTKPFNELGELEKGQNISFLKGKSKRQASGDLFDPENKTGEGIATQLKENILSFKNVLSDVLKSAEDSSLVPTGSSKQIIDVINERLNIRSENDYGDKKNQSWEYFNFYDMPSVAALTILSKWQADIKNMESEVVSFLVNNINTSNFNFSNVNARAIPSSNFVLKGDEFTSTIMLTAYDKSVDAEVFICDYDSLPDGSFEPKGTPEKFNLVDGKAVYKTRANSEGAKSYKGFIKILQDDGYKYYGFNNEYIVASKSYSVSATSQNILYVGVDNPIKVAVAGIPGSDVSISAPFTIKSRSKKEGTYYAVPSPGYIDKKIQIKVSAKGANGKKQTMGTQEFVVRAIPQAEASFLGDKVSHVSVAQLLNQDKIYWKLPKWFKFPGIKRVTKSFDLYVSDGEQTEDIKGIQTMNDARKLLKKLKKGNTVTIKNIKTKVQGQKGSSAPAVGVSFSYTIK